MAGRAFQNGELVWTDNRGRNGFDLPSDIRQGQSCACQNIRLERNQLGRKRHGAASQALTDWLPTQGITALGRFVPAQDETKAELFMVARTGNDQMGHVVGGVYKSLFLVDSIASRPQDTHYAALNGKMYIAYDSISGSTFQHVNRLHVYDPRTVAEIGQDTVRPVGIARPVAGPVVTNTGAGTYAPVLRYYAYAWRANYADGTLQRQSNLSAATAFTPSGTGLAARVARGTPPAFENTTHWVVYGSADNTAYFELAVLALASTVWDDTTPPTLYGTHPAAPAPGTFSPWPSVKFLLSTGVRLIGFGVWEPGAQSEVPAVSGRVYFSPVLDTSDFDDDERVSNDVVGLSATGQGWIDVGRNYGAEDRAISGPYDGNILVFQSRGFYMLLETGDVQAPYERVVMSPYIGAVNQWSTFMGEDEQGRACAYWLDPNRGPYRYGAHGLQWLGYDVQDIWKTVNLNATLKVAHGCYDPERRVCKWWLATGTNNEPGPTDPILVFSVRDGETTDNDGVREGWTIDYGAIANAMCSCVFSTVFGTVMSRSLSAYVGMTNALVRTDDPTMTSDLGQPFQAFVRSRAWEVQPETANKRVGHCYLKAMSAAGVVIQQSLLKNYGDSAARVSTLSIAPQSGETRVVRRFQDAALVDAYTFQTTIGDVAAVANAWTLDEWLCTLEAAEQR
jgi:hypothetical protein